MSASSQLSTYEYAVIRVVPRVEREEFLNAGVILFCRVRRFLGARIALDRTRLAALWPAIDAAEVEEHLRQFELVCRGDPAAGDLARWPPAERFHWLVAPRSTIVQTSPVHAGRTTDPPAELARLFTELVPLPPTEE
jgi:hypothetical protein